jgi:hypothetical protein
MENDHSEKAAEYRREASICLELAPRISLRLDRERMTEMAQRWLDLARQAEARSDMPPRLLHPQSVTQPMQQQPQAQQQAAKREPPDEKQ